MTLKIFTPDLLDDLCTLAEKSPRKRKHYNIHECYSDPCQRLFNAIGRDSYIRPHRHSIDAKDECLIAVRGLFALFTFEDTGEVAVIRLFGSEYYSSFEKPIGPGVELSAGTWHTVVSLEADAVLLELKAGPFNPEAAKEFAEWAPEEDTAEAALYLENLKKLI